MASQQIISELAKLIQSETYYDHIISSDSSGTTVDSSNFVLNPEILANVSLNQIFRTHSYYPKSLYSNGQPYGGNVYACVPDTGETNDYGKYFPAPNGNQIVALFDQDYIAVEQYGVYDDVDKVHTQQYQRAVDYANKVRAKVLQTVNTKASVGLRTRQTLYSNKMAILYSEDNASAIYNIGSWNRVRITDIQAYGVGQQGQPLVPVVSAMLGSSDTKIDMVIRGTTGVTKDGIVVPGYNLVTNTPLNNCYQNTFIIRSGHTSTESRASGEIAGSAIDMGTAQINGLANSNSVLFMVLDGFETGITIAGQRNTLDNITFNGPATKGAIKFQGNGTFGNTLISNYFDSAITGPHIVTDMPTANVTVAGVYGNDGFLQSRVTHLDQVSRIGEFDPRYLQIEGPVLAWRDSDGSIARLRSDNGQLKLNGNPV